MKFRLAIFLPIATLCGCAALWSPPDKAREEASKYLKGNCLNAFLDSSSWKYQHLAQAALSKAVFAVSDTAQGQYCGYASSRDVQEKSFDLGSDWAKIEVVAIARCEGIKPPSAKAPCKVFARNNEIVWSQKSGSSLD